MASLAENTGKKKEIMTAASHEETVSEKETVGTRADERGRAVGVEGAAAVEMMNPVEEDLQGLDPDRGLAAQPTRTLPVERKWKLLQLLRRKKLAIVAETVKMTKIIEGCEVDDKRVIEM